MSYGVTDYAHRYIVHVSKLVDALEWLELNGIKESSLTAVNDVVLIDDKYGMFDGDQCGSPENYESYAFIERFCEEGSYACFRNDDWYEFYFIWKNNDGMHVAEEDVACPFSAPMKSIDRHYPLR